MFADCLGVKEGTCVEESQMHCSEKGLNGRAEESLVHVFNPVLDVCDSVDIVGTVGREGVMLRSVSRRCGMLWCRIL